MRRTSSAEQVAAAIRMGILTGQLERGHRLTQDDIAAQLGMSRIPVREAMIALDREGWVQSESSKGARVTGLEADDVRDQYELRGLVFGLLVERATQTLDPDELGTLLALGATLPLAPSIEAFTETNDRILRTIILAPRSSRLIAALRVMPSIVPDDFFVYVPEARGIQEYGMAEVLRAVAVRDAAAAGARLRALLQQQGEAVIAAFDQRGIMNDRAAAVETAWPRHEPTTSAGSVAAYVREQIFNGAFIDGQRLPQDDIASAVGVSRIPVREAIIALEREGWVRVEPHRGAYVNALDEQAVTDTFTLYGHYFGFAARRAISHMDPAACEDLDRLAADVGRARSAEAMEGANTAYLRLLLTTAASNRLAVVLRSMTQLVPGRFFGTVPGSIKIQATGIPRAQALIAKRDHQGAAGAFVDLQLRQAEAVAKVVRRAHS